MTELAERVEASSGPDRELDAEITATVRHFPNDVGFVWQDDLEPNVPEPGRVTCVTSLGTSGPHYAAPRYTASLDAAMKLVPKDWHIAINGVNDGWHVALNETRDGATGVSFGFASSPPRAMTAACLRALDAIASTRG